jgi:predicted transcriptional regulator
MTPAQKELHDWALKRGIFFNADEAATALNCTRNSALGRMRKLSDQNYMIVRKSKPSSGGQTSYYYKAVMKSVPAVRRQFSECDALVRYAQYGRMAA